VNQEMAYREEGLLALLEGNIKRRAKRYWDEGDFTLVRRAEEVLGSPMPPGCEMCKRMFWVGLPPCRKKGRGESGRGVKRKTSWVGERRKVDNDVRRGLRLCRGRPLAFERVRNKWDVW